MKTNWTRKRQAGGYLIIDDIGRVVAESVMDGESRHIVHCVNNHERLVEALAEVVTCFNCPEWSDRCEEVEAKARALLAQLEAGKGV